MTIAYVGNHFLRALSPLKTNIAVYAPGASTATANVNSRRPYQGIGEIDLLTGYDHGTYNGLQASITKRPAQGLILQASFTWSKALDLNSSAMLGGALGETPRDGNNPNLDKAPLISMRPIASKLWRRMTCRRCITAMASFGSL